MADKSQRLSLNAAGRFYVDDSCTDCDMCREIAPMIFARDAESASSFVLRQPQTAEELELAEQATTSCPTETIGNDG
ncbi:ferredoxin [Verrucomicrobiaceae bacterium SCGC AG-212-N21]|nr:ferredoxin [Verrucomicrobiaceae bacterium SCGC AG-212-N21]